jgi:hypothetical protein
LVSIYCHGSTFVFMEFLAWGHLLHGAGAAGEDTCVDIT